jgi:hypothetical protein
MKPATRDLLAGFRSRREALHESLPSGDPAAAIATLQRVRRDTAFAHRCHRAARGDVAPVSRVAEDPSPNN